MTDDNIRMLGYSKQINELQLDVLIADMSIEAKVHLVKKIRRRTKALQSAIVLRKKHTALIAYETTKAEEQKQCILTSEESTLSRLEQLTLKYLLDKQASLDRIENTNANLKQYEEQWLTITKQLKTIPYMKEYLDTQEKFETVTANINAMKIESEKLRSQIVLKKAELFEKDKKNIIEMADFMINKRPVLLKLINEKKNEYKNLKNEEKMTILINTALATTSTLPMIEAYDTLALPKLHLHDMDVGTISQVHNVNNRATNKRPADFMATVELNKKLKVAEEIEEAYYSLYFTPRNIGGNDTKKYSDKKIINIIDDITNEICKIDPSLNLNELQDVNVIKARVSQDSKNNDPPQNTANEKIAEVVEEVDSIKVSQDIILPPTPFMDLTQIVNVIKARVSQDSKKNDPPQNMANEKIAEVVEEVDSIKVSQDIILPPTPFMDLTQVNQKLTDVVGEIDLTQKISQDNIILPPTPFMDLPQNSQEKRVTFNTVVRVEDIPNLETDGDELISQYDYNGVNNTPNDQLNASTASDDSYKKIEDFVFKKYNVNLLSPEFTYTKNKIVPIVAEEKVVTSKFFDENQGGNIVTDNSIKEKIETGNSEKEINEVPTETINQDKSTAENLLEGQEYKLVVCDDVPSCAPSFPYIQSMAETSYVSTSTTGSEEEDTEFPQCIDSSFLLSPKAYDENQTHDDARNVNILPEKIARILSAIRKTPFSFLGESSSLNNPGADGQN